MDERVDIFEQSKRYRRPSVIEKKNFFVDSQTPLYPFSMLKNATVDTVKWLQH